MENQAYKWLNEWVESGGHWYHNSHAGVVNLSLDDARSPSINDVWFRHDMRKLIFYALLGRQICDLIEAPTFEELENG